MIAARKPEGPLPRPKAMTHNSSDAGSAATVVVHYDFFFNWYKYGRLQSDFGKISRTRAASA
jgi:hypothetical protein